MLKIAICEDEVRHQEILEKLIRQQLNTEEASITIFSTGSDLIDIYKNGSRYDILFLDVHLQEENGINIGGFIRRVDQKVKIVLATSMMEAAMEGYGIGVQEFLLKPISEPRFKEVFQKVVHELTVESKHKYTMEIRSEKVIIDIKDIIYIESAGRKLNVYTTSKTYEHYRRLSEDEQDLCKGFFVKPHRSYLVNLNYIHRIKRLEILLKDETRIPVTLKNRDLVYDRYAQYLTEGF